MSLSLCLSASVCLSVCHSLSLSLSTSGSPRVNRLKMLLCILGCKPPNKAKTMPIAGLPAEVEGVLEVVFMLKVLTSWKTAGDGDSTVVVLRLTSHSTRYGARPQIDNAAFRRSSPSPLRRDRRRAGRTETTTGYDNK